MVMTFTYNYRLHRRAGWSALRPAIFSLVPSDNRDTRSTFLVLVRHQFSLVLDNRTNVNVEACP